MSCPPTTRLLDFVAGALSGDEAAALEAHIDACEGCRAGLSELVRGEREGGAAVRRALLERGDAVSRYLIIDLIGAGAMGVVYEAYDPELHRHIAVKVLREDTASAEHVEAQRQRLLAEARAMARLHHPNVVAAFDVGTFEEQVFIAMERVEGSSLREWLHAAPRRPAEVLLRFVEAGRGLWAAHQAGMVHRDFKPDNVLVGSDGAKVTDFGLARQLEAAVPALPADAAALQTQGLVGTPVYLAPEVLDGQPATARADQFAFCVALFEALWGVLPFEGDTPQQIIEAVRAGRRRPAAAAPRVPRRVREAIERGLRREPGDRFADMGQLLHELGRPQASRWRWAALTATGAAAVLAAGLVSGVLRSPTPCALGPQQLAGVWDEAARARVRGALLATQKPYAAETWSHVARTLDDYAAAWVSGYRDACEATHVRQDQSPELMDRRMVCLRARLGQLRASVEVLSEADDAVVAKAAAVARAPAPVSACTDPRVLATFLADVDSGPSDPALRAAVDRANALRSAGRPKDALEVARAAATEAHTAKARSLEAEARVLVALLTATIGEHDDARRELKEALLCADRARHDRARARVLVGQSFFFALWGDFAAAGTSAEEASAVLERIGGDADLVPRLANARGISELQQGHFEAAIEQLQQALAGWAAIAGPQRAEALIALNNLANVYSQTDDVATALERIGEAKAMMTEVLGGRHPEMAMLLVTSGSLLHKAGRFDDAERDYLAAGALYEETTGARTPPMVLVHLDLGMLYEDRGQLDAAQKAYALGEAIATETQGENSMWTANARKCEANLALRRRDFPRALALAEAALATRRAMFGESHPETLEARELAAQARLGLRRFAEALAELDAGLATARRAQAPELLVRSYQAARGRGLLGLKRSAEAIADLEQAVSFYRQRKGRDRWDLGDPLLALADALWVGGKDRRRARALGEEALAVYAELGEVHPADVADARRWLAGHPAAR